jgi:hypothetical protein
MYCPHCGAENFYDVDVLAAGGTLAPCWSCSKEVPTPPRIRIDKQIIMLNHDTKLFPHHVDSEQLYTFSQPIAEISRHPNDPNIWGLKNLSGDKWVSTTAEGAVKDVEPGRSVTLGRGTKINFGKSEGEIRI